MRGNASACFGCPSNTLKSNACNTCQMSRYFDYIIIGGGLAGLQLALKFGTDRFFEQKTIVVIDPSPKNTNDKIWCFWEQGEGQWDHIITKSWDKGLFFSAEKEIALNLTPYRYKMLRALDFYEEVHNKLKELPNFSFILDTVEDIDQASCVVSGKTDSYNALHIFDSRITSDYAADVKSSILYQHFKGWRIKTIQETFDPDVFTMMDFRIKHKDSTSITYLLPISKTEALVEFTLFTPYLTEDIVYEENLKKYISSILKLQEYTIEETEKGVIPMTDFPFHEDSTPRITKIGTGGSWVKGSTGYSFKHTEKKTEKIISNIQKGFDPGEKLVNKDKRRYDAIFIDVLKRNNEMGENIFTKLYSRNEPQKIFRFLDEETSFTEDLKIMFSLFHPQFLISFYRKI